MSISVKIDEDDLLNMLLERCNAWGTSKENIDLFEKMYENYINSSCFEGMEININRIVDNNAVNNCSIIKEGDEDFKELLNLYKEGNSDVSCETQYSCIEAVSNDETRILVRW